MKKIINVLSSIAISLTVASCLLIGCSFADDKSVEKKKGKPVVTFKDGSAVTDADINNDIEDVSDQISSKMSLKEIKTFLAWKAAYKKVMNAVAKESGAADDKDVKDVIAKRKITAAGILLSEEEAKKLMTREALIEHYNKTWDKNFKGKKEFSLVAITTNDKGVADRIKNSVKDEASLKRVLDSNKATTKSADMDSRPQGIFPPEISEAVLKQGEKTIVGPFELKGSYMLFYVKTISDAKKKEFTNEFEESYKKAAFKDFLAEYMKTLYAKYKVKIFDVNKKEVDPFAIIKNNDVNDKKKDQTEKLAKLQDGDVLAVVDKDNVTVKELKEFFKVKSLLDPAFLSMAQQFGIKPEEVIVHAVKLLTDDKVLAKEVVLSSYDKSPEVASKLQEIEDMEIQHAYFKKNVKVDKADVKRTYDDFIKSIPEADKNDHEIAIKLAFFATREDASRELKSITAGDAKFGEIFKKKSTGNEKTAVDVGYVKKQDTPPELWALLKRGASGTCCRDILEINGAQYGIKGKNYAIVYIGDRRPITLPSLSNEGDRKYFERLAERQKAVEIAKQHLRERIQTIEGRSFENLIKDNATYVNSMISVLIGQV
ncbi:MAG: peptidyl-prolyl cis-trans isomerase [Holosporales bacterium]|jgi:hypothetical protein|nr:peptidyl-prolyl cis-trans isomerase [Holosporales bacterium]